MPCRALCGHHRPVDGGDNGRSHVQLKPAHPQAELRVEDRAKSERSGQPRRSKVAPFRRFVGAAWRRVAAAATNYSRGWGEAWRGRGRCRPKPTFDREKKE